MSAKHLGVSLLLAFACTCASAGPVYKIVGPDGKVTFSDKPSAEAASGTYQVVGNRGAAAQPATAAPASAANAGGNEIRLAANAAPNDAARLAPSAEIRTAPSAEVEGAIVGVLGIEDIVKRTEALCAEALPTSAGQYGAAVAAWQTRNAAVVTRAHEALASGFDPADRAATDSGIRGKNDGMFTAVRAASTAARTSWCEESFASMNDGAMDVHDNPRFTTPLTLR